MVPTTFGTNEIFPLTGYSPNVTDSHKNNRKQNYNLSNIRKKKTEEKKDIFRHFNKFYCPSFPARKSHVK